MKEILEKIYKEYGIVLFLIGVLIGYFLVDDFFNPVKQGASTIEIDTDDTHDSIIKKAAFVVPTKNQYAYKKLEFTCFVHFGVNTFTREEWGDGFEDPKIFNLQNLDTDQWCKTAKEAGMKLVMFTAKHHDGFVLWQSRYTKHGVMSSPFKNGKGDVLKELAASCKKYGLKLGFYLSPADLYQIENKEGLYGNLSKKTERVIPRPVPGRPFENKTSFTFKVDDYNEYFLNQLFELLTEYGPIHEVWFDGAHPKRKGGQKYNYLAWKKVIQTLAPETVIFGKEDVRWCGNEKGATRISEWDVVTFDKDPRQKNDFPDMHGDLGTREKLKGAKYLHYLAAETDTSIREGWFYRNEYEQKVRTVDDVFDIYERSVGGNSNLLLNIPPNRQGRFSDEDVRVLKEVGKRIKETYGIGTDLLKDAKGEDDFLDADEDTYVLAPEGKSSYVITLRKEVKLNRFVLQEAIHKEGQRIEKHALDAWIDGAWKEVANATIVGHKRILRFADITTAKLRLRIEQARYRPSIAKVSAHYYMSRPPQLDIHRNLKGEVSIAPKTNGFAWKLHHIDYQKNMANNLEIRYTTDGTMPSLASKKYTKPFVFASGEIKTKAFESKQEGSVSSRILGLIQKDWRVQPKAAKKAIDADINTYWHSAKGTIGIDLRSVKSLKGFIYTPPEEFKKGLVEKGLVKISTNGTTWETVETFTLGNLINDPTPRAVYFKEAIKARYLKITCLSSAGGGTAISVAELEVLE